MLYPVCCKISLLQYHELLKGYQENGSCMHCHCRQLSGKQGKLYI